MSDREIVGQLHGSKGSLEIEWKITDFLSQSKEVDDSYCSPTFFFCDASWYLQLHPNGETEHSSEGYIGIYLVRGDSGPPVSVWYHLWLKKSHGEQLSFLNAKDTFKEKDIGWGNTEVILRKEVIESKSSEFLPSGVLTVGCSLECDETRGITSTEKKEVAIQTAVCEELSAVTPKTQVLCDFEKLLISEDGCDVTLQVQGRTFEAHRTILRARSSVFASMLTHNMKEKNTGLIDIEDCDPETFPDFLRFLYGGSVDTITSQNVCSLFKAADKYHVQDLKSECLAFIKNHLHVENFCDIIALALRHDEADLVKQATDFFTRNMLEIVMTVQWQTFLAENPTPSNELIIKGLSALKSCNH